MSWWLSLGCWVGVMGFELYAVMKENKGSWRVDKNLFRWRKIVLLVLGIVGVSWWKLMASFGVFVLVINRGNLEGENSVFCRLLIEECYYFLFAFFESWQFFASYCLPFNNDQELYNGCVFCQLYYRERSVHYPT